MKIRSKTIPATLVAAGLFGFGPKSIAAEESIAELRTLIQQLDQKIKVLERKQELDKDTASEKVQDCGRSPAPQRPPPPPRPMASA